MYNRPHGRRAFAALSGLILAMACTDTSTLPTEVDVRFAKGGGGPTVEGADPSAAPQGVTIDVRVIGSGFDDGSTVKFLLSGKSTPKILTNSTTFDSNDNTLTANITIAVDADVALYDIKVTSSRGRKGIGSELFGVEEEGGNGGGSSSEIELLSLEVQVLRDGITHGMTDVQSVDDEIAVATATDEFLCRRGAASEECDASERAAFFGCPDSGQPCTKILLTFDGGSPDSEMGIRVAHSVQGCVEGGVIGGCVFDLDLSSAWKAASWSQGYQPALVLSEVSPPALKVNADGTRTLTVYWQGQRGQRRVWSDTNRVWSRYPDLDPVAGTDYFVFRAYSGNRTFQACSSPDPCWTEYSGEAGTQAYVVLDDISLLVRKRGKKTQTTGIEFEIQTFSSNPRKEDGSVDYLDSNVVGLNLESSSEVMLIGANGSKQMLSRLGTGINPDDPDKPEIYKSNYTFSFPESGCYEFRLLEVFVQDVDNLEYVWYAQGDVAAVKELWVDHVEGGETTWSSGVSCG